MTAGHTEIVLDFMSFGEKNTISKGVQAEQSPEQLLGYPRELGLYPCHPSLPGQLWGWLQGDLGLLHLEFHSNFTQPSLLEKEPVGTLSHMQYRLYP